MNANETRVELTGWATLMMLAVITAGCGPADAPGEADAGTPVDVTCPSSPSAQTAATVFTSVVSPTCVTGCHTPGGIAVSYGDYTTEAKMFASMVGHASIYETSRDPGLQLVKPGDLSESTVWLKTACTSATCSSHLGVNVGSSMPEGRANLSADTLALLRDWVCGGALQN